MLGEEPGHERVEGLLWDAVISSVNAAEALRVLERALGPEPALAAFRTVDVPVVDYTAEDAAETVRVARIAPALGLGDCACLAAARPRGAGEVLTTDRLRTR